MDVNLKKPLPDNPRNILRRAGYAEHFDSRAQKTSYSLRLGSGRYPRFHCYIKETDATVGFSLHIDQKEASYEGAGHMHAGEYDGKLVEDEMARIGRWAGASNQNTGASASSSSTPSGTTFQSSSPTLPTSRPTKKPSFWQRLFPAKIHDRDE